MSEQASQGGVAEGVVENVYIGRRGKDYAEGVHVNGRQLDPRLDLRGHSPTGFEWGYGGSGPAQLSLAILANEFGDAFAQAYYQGFKAQVVQGLPRESFSSWRLTSSELTKWREENVDGSGGCAST